MALPTAYLNTVGNLSGILEAIKGAKAPSRFTQKFLVGLGFASAGDRPVIGVLKALGFLNEGGAPTPPSTSPTWMRVSRRGYLPMRYGKPTQICLT